MELEQKSVTYGPTLSVAAKRQLMETDLKEVFGNELLPKESFERKGNDDQDSVKTPSAYEDVISRKVNSPIRDKKVQIPPNSKGDLEMEITPTNQDTVEPNVEMETTSQTEETSNGDFQHDQVMSLALDVDRSAADCPGRTVLTSTNDNNEDDIDTVASNDTLTGDRVQDVIPAWTRFRIIVNIKALPMELLARKQRGEELPAEFQNNDLRLLKVLKSFFAHILSFNETAMLLEWSAQRDNEGAKAILRPDALPTATSDIIKYFEGFKGKDSGAAYI